MERWDDLLDQAQVTRDSYVVDIGCGDGTLARAAAARGALSVGMDFRPRPSDDDGCLYLAADAAMTPLRSNTFDAALSRSVLVWSNRRGPIVREAARVLKSGAIWCGIESLNGQIEIEIPDQGLQKIWSVLREALDQLVPVTLTSNMVKNLLESGGFDPVEVKVEEAAHLDWDPREFFFALRGPQGFSIAEYWHSGGIPRDLIAGWVEGLASTPSKLKLAEARFRAVRED